MDNIIKFTLSGYGATFTKPYFNSYQATYNHIHKVAVLGILGAIIGIEKNNLIFKKEKSYSLPKFYTELNSIKVSIVPSKPLFFKDKPSITETTGFFNNKDTFISEIEELINPSWDIYLINEGCSHFETIKDMLLKGTSIFDLYLGKNHHFANISNVSIESGINVSLDDFNKIDSLFPIDNIEILDDEDDECESDYKYIVKEFMPVSFSSLNNQYEEKMISFTNNELESDEDIYLVKINDKLLYFI